MIQRFTLILLIGCSVGAYGQYFQTFINEVNAATDPADKTELVDSFMNAATSFPYISGDTANFIYRGSVSSVHVAGDFNFWDFSFDEMTQLSGTDFWYRSKVFEPNARLDYKFVTNESSWILDPLNPNEILGGFGPNSELAMPEYIHPWEIEYQDGIAHGTIEEFSISSTYMGSDFQLKVYLPPGYDEMSGTQYPVAYFQDGFEMISLASGDNILDNLIDSNLISPIISVFVRPNSRDNEYAFDGREDYRQFFVEELVPYIDANYKTIANAEHRAVIGLSFGANISGLISYKHPEVFGNCGLQSAAFWPNDYEVYDLITQGPVKDIRYVSIWGSYEGSLTINMEIFRFEMESKGYDFTSDELPEGHSWGLWRATTDDILKVFFPPGLTGIEDPVSPIAQSLKAYPNPAQEVLRIELPSGTGDYHLLVADLSGRIHGEFHGDAGTQPATVDVDVSAMAEGLYVYQLRTEAGRYAGRFEIVR